MTGTACEFSPFTKRSVLIRLSVLLSLSELKEKKRKENLIRNDPDKSEFTKAFSCLVVSSGRLQKTKMFQDRES